MKTSLTISRLHKVAERISQHINELYDGSRMLAPHVMGSISAGALERWEKQGNSCVAAFQKAERLSRELAKLRGVIGTYNAQAGVYQLLAQQSALSKHLQKVKAAMESVANSELRLADLAANVPVGEYGKNVALLSAEDEAQLHEVSRQIQRELFSISDAIAQANAAAIEVELSPEAMEVALGT